MTSILKEIVRRRIQDVEGLRERTPLDQLEREVVVLEGHPFRGALADAGSIHIIAEIKKGSPSRGVIRKDFDPAGIARAYETGGASALSVLTEERYFYGSPDHLKVVKQVTNLPVLCKDFVLDRYQVCFARFVGADAVLLIARLLEPDRLRELIRAASDLGMDALVETHCAEESAMALECGASIIGVNNRNLDTFETDIGLAISLAGLIPPDIISVAESGIFGRDDIARLQDAGYNNFLIGEALMRSADPAVLIKELKGE